MIAVMPAANADTTIRDKCRDTSFRMEHRDLCQTYYGPGPFTPNQPDPGDGGLLGLIGRLLGGIGL